MSIDEVVGFIAGLEGVLVLEPGPGDGSPEISWGDRFFYYAPDGVDTTTQPFATVVTKDYQGDDTSQLNRPGAFRVNVAPAERRSPPRQAIWPRVGPIRAPRTRSSPTRCTGAWAGSR